MSDDEYVGSELELFRAAINWKSYLRDQLTRYLGNVVLEVGAGLGGTTGILCSGREERWVCMEPDARLARQIESEISRGALPTCCEVVISRLDQYEVDQELFDTVLYIDVLEHIEDDRRQLQDAVRVLRPEGRIVVLSPAHQWLYTPFDEAIGHFRRYTRRSLAALTPQHTKLDRALYLDAVGLCASLGNRVLLKHSMPTATQIAIWDRAMVPLSRWVDPLLFHSIGKSVLAVWTKVGPVAAA